MVRKTLALLLKREEKGGEGERRMTQESSLSVYLKDSPVSKQRYGRSSTHTLIHNTGSTATLVAWVESQSLPTDSLTAVGFKTLHLISPSLMRVHWYTWFFSPSFLKSQICSSCKWIQDHSGKQWKRCIKGSKWENRVKHSIYDKNIKAKQRT